MRDFPIFTTEYGLSSLILKEIPYRKTAYIRILDVQSGQLENHIQECVSFCRMAGAEHIYAAGEGLEAYPVYTSVVQMRRNQGVDREQLACLFPVTETTVSRWRELYNKSMVAVDNAGTLEAKDEQKILEKPGAYFIHDDGNLLGIGWLDGGKILAVAAMEKGAGERVMHTLMSLGGDEGIELEVASTNVRAMHLYEKLGFLKTKEIVRWHKIL